MAHTCAELELQARLLAADGKVQLVDKKYGSMSR
jgi:hypothetical protein